MEKIKIFFICPKAYRRTGIMFFDFANCTQFTGFLTGGLLETSLKTPDTVGTIIFNQQIDNIDQFKIEGLIDYWNNDKEKDYSQLTIHYQAKSQTTPVSKTLKIPFRNQRIRIYAVELIAYHILKFLKVTAT